LENGDYYNTAFVVDSQGEIAFKQAKSRPVQFLKDGLPAKERKLWNSPWGPIAIAVCNDSGYRRALDDFAKQGAVAFVIPTLDAANWGEAQHRLHGGIVQMRAAEYHVPVFRLCGTGVSEFVATNGVVLASTPFAVERSILESKLELGPPARLPADRWLNLVAVIITAAAASWFASLAVLRWRLKRKVGQRKV
jgi:apolipoprotein N-acyltransferase